MYSKGDYVKLVNYPSDKIYTHPRLKKFEGKIGRVINASVINISTEKHQEQYRVMFDNSIFERYWINGKFLKKVRKGSD